MRQVFVTKSKGNKWKITDKKTNKVIDYINDVLLLNATYKKHNSIKGWHGILSEHFNISILDLISYPFFPIIFLPKTYYPRSPSYQEHPVKNAKAVRLYKDNISIFGIEQYMSDLELHRYTRDWGTWDSGFLHEQETGGEDEQEWFDDEG